MAEPSYHAVVRGKLSMKGQPLKNLSKKKKSKKGKRISVVDVPEGQVLNAEQLALIEEIERERERESLKKDRELKSKEDLDAEKVLRGEKSLGESVGERHGVRDLSAGVGAELTGGAALLEDKLGLPLTKAERAFLLKKQEREGKMVEERSSQAYRERINNLNNYLTKLTEHNDIAKVGWTG